MGNQNEPLDAPEQTTKYVSLPYVPHLSNSITRCLQEDYPSTKIANNNVRTAKMLYTNVKDPVEPMLQHNVIYNIPCQNCEGCYIGMTTNKLKTRMSGHKSNINKLDGLLNLGYTYSDQAVIEIGNKTALINHCIKYQHRFGLDQTKIIDRSFTASRLPMLECFHIYNTPRTVNYRTDVEGVSSIYAGLLHTIAKSSQKTKTNTAPPPPPLPPPLPPPFSTTPLQPHQILQPLPSPPAPMSSHFTTSQQPMIPITNTIPPINNSE